MCSLRAHCAQLAKTILHVPGPMARVCTAGSADLRGRKHRGGLPRLSAIPHRLGDSRGDCPCADAMRRLADTARLFARFYRPVGSSDHGAALCRCVHRHARCAGAGGAGTRRLFRRCLSVWASDDRLAPSRHFQFRVKRRASPACRPLRVTLNPLVEGFRTGARQPENPYLQHRQVRIGEDCGTRDPPAF